MDLRFRVRKKVDHWTVEYRRKLPMWFTLNDYLLTPTRFYSYEAALYGIKNFINKDLPKPINSLMIEEIHRTLSSIETIEEMS